MAARRKGPWLRWPMPEIVAHRPGQDGRESTRHASEEGYTPTTVFVLPSSQNLRDAIRASGLEQKGRAGRRVSPRNMP